MENISMVRTLKLLIYFTSRALGLFSLALRLTHKRPRILCYHGGAIGDEWKYNGLLFMSKSVFLQRIDWLQKNGFQFVSLDSLFESNVNARSGKPIVVLTFDDGWFSTGSELLPILEIKRIPSVLYLSTKQFRDGYPILAVTLGYLLWMCSKRLTLIEKIDHEIDGEYDLNVESERSRLIANVIRWASQGERSREEVVSILEAVAVSLGFSEDVLKLATRRFEYMSADEIRRFAYAGCSIELHGHIHRYPVGDPILFQEDLRNCDEVIQDLGLPKPKHYCYPSGGFDHIASEVLRAFGVLSATTCVPGLVNMKSQKDAYYLPRFLDGESIHTLEFEAEMTGFSELLRRVVRTIKR
jgi:peptidoglycan/xylan/chitin deacetylase (PgdA/CDA1 family)